MSRHIVWFSYGAASAVAWITALEIYDNVIAVNCDTSSNEHHDNARFKSDMEKATGRKVITIQSKKYKTIEEVSSHTRYMAGTNGARCTTELKKYQDLIFSVLMTFIYSATQQEKNHAIQILNKTIRIS